MELDFNEDVAEGLEKWLKERRNECPKTNSRGEQSYYTIDNLLDEVRECAAMGFFPWSNENQEYRERDHY